MYGDAPDDNYFDIEDENAEEKYKELLKQSGVAATLGLDVNSLPLFKHEPVPKTDNKGNTTEEITGKKLVPLFFFIPASDPFLSVFYIEAR